MNKYEITIPGRGTYQVESDSELTDAQAYQAALDQASQEGGSLQRGAGIAARASAPTALGAAIGSLGGPAGAVAGSLAVPAADLLSNLINSIMAGGEKLTGKEMPRIMPTSQAIQNLMTMAGVPGAPATQSPTERVLSTGLEAATNVASQVPKLAQMAAQAASPVTREVSRQLAVAPGTQMAVAPSATMAGQTVTEATGSPVAGALTTLATGMAGSVKTPQKERALPSQTLDQIANDRYARLQESGIELQNDKFVDQMGQIAKDLRKEGYTPKAYPKIAGAIEELTSTAQPKDWTELQALRKMIRAGQTSTDPSEKRLASILLDKYDDYLLNVPRQDIAAGDAKNLGSLWNEAKDAYSRMKKSEVFEDMLEAAQLDRSKFTQSGYENSMANQLRQLAKNDKKLRLFNKDEQDAIKEAAKGGTVQNLLKLYGRFAPTGPVGGLFAGGASVLEPTIGLPFTAGAAGSRMAATRMRESSIENLANMMRLGRVPQVEAGAMRAVPATGLRGLLSLQDLEEQQRNLMGIR